jgi:hypothetical protein
MSYYGYVKRENAAGVNWQEVGENLSNVLLEAGAERQAKRDAFDEATREYQEILNNAPSGDFKTGNAFALNHAADASRMRLIQDRLLKSGVMKDRDYTVARQNLTDGTKQLFGLAEEYQTEYTEKMARLKDGKSQELESWLMANIEGLSNLKNAQSYINQEDGSVSIGKLVEGPSGTRVLSKNPNDFMTVNQLRNRYKEKYDKFDVSGTMTMEAERLGTFIDSVRRAGGPEYAGTITKLLDPTMRGTLGPNGEKAVDSFLNMEKDMINGYLEANPLNGLSVLTNTIAINPDTGAPFEPTFDADEAKKDPNKVLIRDDGSGRIEPILKDKQKKLVFESVQTNFRNKIDREKTITTYQEPKESASEVAKGTKEDKDKNVVSNVAQLYFGDDAEVKEAEDFLRSINPNIESIDRTSENVIVTFNDGRAAETLSWKGDDGTLLDQASWVTGSANFFLDDKSKIGNINDVLGKSGIDLSKDFNEVSTGFSAGAVEKEQTIQEAYEDYLNDKIDGSRFSYTTETGIVDNANEKMVKDFKASIPDGFELTEVTGYRPETIDRLVKIQKKGGKSLEVDITKPGYDKVIKDFILDNSTSEEDIKRMALTPGVKKKKVRTQVRSSRGSGELD